VHSAKAVPLAEGQNLSDREALICDDVKVTAVFVMQFQHPNPSEFQFPFQQGEELIPEPHSCFQRVDFSECERPEIQPRILPKHLPNSKFEGGPALHPIPV
jgi:hypothetical protein